MVTPNTAPTEMELVATRDETLVLDQTLFKSILCLEILAKLAIKYSGRAGIISWRGWVGLDFGGGKDMPQGKRG